MFYYPIYFEDSNHIVGYMTSSEFNPNCKLSFYK